MAYVEKLEEWRQGKLDRFDRDDEYRHARLLKHGTRTGFEEFLDRSIEKQIKIQLSGGGSKGKEKKSKKKTSTSTASGKSEDPTAAAVRSLNAFERMAQGLKRGILGAGKNRDQPTPEEEQPTKLDPEQAESTWNAALERMDAETRSMWDFLERSEQDREEIKRRFLLALETGVRTSRMHMHPNAHFHKTNELTR